jgi:hypothetical protein
MRTQKDHKCKNPSCTNNQMKDKYGNYKTYCSDQCRDLVSKDLQKETYSKRTDKERDAILEKRKATNTEKFGVENPSFLQSVKDTIGAKSKKNAKETQQKIRQSNLMKYGVESTNSLDSVKEKKKNVIKEKYGVNHQMQVSDIAAKTSAGLKEHYSTEKGELSKEQRAATKMIIYGDANYNNREKYRETCIEKFGVENPSQNAEINHKKLVTQNKIYEMPSGTKHFVQGHEPQALDELLKIFDENDIVLGKGQMPEIWYDYDGIKRRYFPDIYIPKEKLLIEVKCEWTYDSNGFDNRLEQNLLKHEASLKENYKHIFMIFNNQGTKLLTEVKW